MESSIFILEQRFALYNGDISPDLLYLFDTQDGRILKMNKVAFAIVELIDGKRTIADILKVLQGRFQVDADTLRRDVFSLINQLKEQNIILERR